MRTATGKRISKLAALLPSFVLISLLVACRASTPLTQPSWPAPSDPMQRATDAGLTPRPEEHLNTHIHAFLNIFVDGQKVTVPGGIGIDVNAKGVTEEETPDGTAIYYGVRQCDAPCLSPLHTHDPSGLVHTESEDPNQQPYTLGQFFSEWGVRLDGSCVGEFCTDKTSIAVYTNGAREKGNPADIRLTRHLVIAIVIGTPPSQIPSHRTWLEGE
jgi:hypothetical protein